MKTIPQEEIYSCKDFLSPLREMLSGIRDQDVGQVEMHQTDLIEKGNSYSNCMVPYSFPRIIIKFMSPAKGALLSFTDIFLLLSLSLVGTLTFSYVSQLMPQNYSIYKCNN